MNDIENSKLIHTSFIYLCSFSIFILLACIHLHILNLSMVYIYLPIFSQIIVSEFTSFGLICL